MTLLNISQNFLTPLTAVTTKSGLIFEYEQLLTIINATCTRQMSLTVNKQNCSLTLIAPKIDDIIVQESLPWLDFQTKDNSVISIFKPSMGNELIDKREIKTVFAELQGPCCWVLFTEGNFQGHSETACGYSRTLMLSNIKSIKKV